jgi:hypothetical protein
MTDRVEMETVVVGRGGAREHAFDLSPNLGRQCVGLLTLFLDRHVPSVADGDGGMTTGGEQAPASGAGRPR